MDRGEKEERSSFNGDLPAPNHSSISIQGGEGYPPVVAGRCFKCLGLGHQKAQCTGQIRCFRCWFSGHLASFCTEHDEVSSPPARLLTASSLLARVHRRRPFTDAMSSLLAQDSHTLLLLRHVRHPASSVDAPPRLPIAGRLDEEEAHPWDVVKSSKEMAGFQICAAREHAYMEGFRVGEPELRPGTGRCVLSWTAGMEHNEAWLN